MKGNIEQDLEKLNFLNGMSCIERFKYSLTRAKAQLRLTRKKPLLGWSIFRFWMHNKISKKPRMRVVDLMVTGKCNFECSHCYASNWTKQENVNISVLENTINELSGLGVFHYTLQGGEPLTDLSRLKEMIKICKPHRSYINVVTNGWLVTPVIVKELKEIGVDKITVSLDSGIPEEHDNFRNKPGSFDRVIKAIKFIRDENLHTGISTCITHQNLHSEGMKRLFAFAIENRVKVTINVASLAGRWEQAQTEMLITDEDAQFMLSKHLAESTDLNATPIIGRDIYHHHGRVGCPAVKESLSISASGDVFPCVFIHIALGNIKHQSIKSMIDGALKNEYFGRWNPKCLAGEDMGFIEKYFIPYLRKEKPLKGSDVFKIEGLCKECKQSHS